MPTITFRLCDDDDEGQQKKSPPTSSNEDGKTTTRKKKNSKKDASPSQKPLLIKQEDDTSDDDVVIVSETSRGGNNGTGATSTPAASHQINSKKSVFMRRMEELTKNAAATRTSENLQPATTDAISALPIANPPTSKRKRNVQEKTEKSKKPRMKQSKESSKSPTVSLPEDEESFYMNCTDEELKRWLKEKYEQKAERIREQLQLQMKEHLALLRNKRNLAELLANDDISEKQQTQTKKQINQKQTKPAPKTQQTTTPPKQSQASTSAATNSSSSPSKPMINISTQGKSCPTCKLFCKLIYTSKSGCEHQYCEACVVVASFASNGQDDTNSNSEQMTNKKSTPAAVSLASTCTKSTAMQSGSTQGSSTLSIPVPSSCPICHIIDCQPNKPPPVQNVVAVKPKRKSPYVPEWIQSPLEQQELGLERRSPPRNHMSPPPLGGMPPPPGGLPMISAASLILPSTHPASSRTQNADRLKQDTNIMDRNLQSEIEKGEMLKYLLSQQEQLQRMVNVPPQQEQYPPAHPYHPYYGRF